MESRDISAKNVRLNSHNQWVEFTHTESNYKDFLTNHSQITYRNPVKRHWKTAA